MEKPSFPDLLRNKWEYLLPCLAFLVAFVARYHFLAKYHYPMMIHEQDAVGYMDAARSILKLQLPDITGRPPGYPAVIALFAALPGTLEHAARLASIFMDCLIVLPLFLVARIFLSRLASFAVCMLWAFFSFALYFSPSPLSQSTYLCFLLFGIALLHCGFEKRHPGWFCGSGLFFSCSYLARPEGIVGYACGFVLCLTVLFEKEGTFRQKLLIPAAFLAGFLLLGLPYVSALHAHYGNWTMSPMSEAHVKTADAVLTLDARGELQRTGSTGVSVWKEYYKTFPVFREAVRSNFEAFAKVYARTFPLWVHLITAAGIVALALRSRWRQFALMAIPLAVTAPNFVVTIPKTHSYLYPVFAAGFIFFVSFFDALVRVAKRVAPRLPLLRVCEVAISAIMVLTVSYLAYGACRKADDSYKGLATQALVTEMIYKGAGEVIRDHSGTNDVIMTRWGLVGYFADRPVLTLPKGGPKEVVDYGRNHGARYIVIDTTSVLSRRQELMELLAPLQERPVNSAYGIDAVEYRYFGDIGGYVIYRYRQ